MRSREIENTGETETRPYRLIIDKEVYLINPDLEPDSDDDISKLVVGAMKSLKSDLKHKENQIERKNRRKSELNILKTQADLMRGHLRILQGKSGGLLSFIKSGEDNGIVGIRITDDQPVRNNVGRVTINKTS